MKFTKKLLIPLSIAVVLATGGIFMINPFTGEKESQYKREQDRIANYLVEHYELTSGDDIKTIEVTEFQKIEITGYWRITAKVNGKYYISFSEGALGKEISTSNYSPKEFKTQDNVGNRQSLSNIEMIYYD